jgi:tryptophan synthase alpha chain
MVGFGISNKSTFSAACEFARGGIIGSKFVSLLEEQQNPDRAIERLMEALK